MHFLFCIKVDAFLWSAFPFLELDFPFHTSEQICEWNKYTENSTAPGSSDPPSASHDHLSVSTDLRDKPQTLRASKLSPSASLDYESFLFFVFELFSSAGINRLSIRRSTDFLDHGKIEGRWVRLFFFSPSKWVQQILVLSLPSFKVSLRRSLLYSFHKVESFGIL